MLKSTPLHIAIALSAAVFTSSVVHADYITITTQNGSFELYGGDFSSLLSGGGQEFSMTDLEILTETLNNDDIDTEGKLSFILASTDAGLSFIGLFNSEDDEHGRGNRHDDDDDDDDGSLGLITSTGMGTNWFISEYDDGVFDWYDLGNGSQRVEAAFKFEDGDSLAGFSWGNVTAAPSAEFTLFDFDLTEFAHKPIQFVTFEDDQWSVIEDAKFHHHEYAFSYEYIPAPGALALFGIATLIGWRTRREDQ